MAEKHNALSAAEEGGLHDGKPNYTYGADIGRQLSTVTLTPEQFERLYLQPRDPRQVGDLPKRFGNPTPLGIASFCVVLTTLSGDLLGFRGTDSTSAVSQVGAYWFVGGIGLFISGLLEFFIGNTFPFVVFVTFGGFWWSYASLVQPTFAITAAYAAGDAAAGAASVPFNSGVAWYLLVFGLLCFVYMICALRTNLVLVWILGTVMMALFLLAAGYFAIGRGSANAVDLITAGGAFAFACSMGGWYLLFALLFEAVGMPISLPVGDLSNRILIRK